MRRIVPLALLVLASGCLSGLGAKSRREKEAEAAASRVPPPADWLERVVMPEGLARPAPKREADIAAAVRDLQSDDFGDRTRGSRALLAYGEVAIPYLGERADAARVPPDPDCPYCILVGAIMTQLPPARLREHIDSPYAIVRIAASAAAGERGLAELAPVVAERLDDPELEVRRAAVTALRRITHRFLGYRASDSEAERAEATAAWRRAAGAPERETDVAPR